MLPINSTIVFQNEFAIVQASDTSSKHIYTTTPYQCVVIALYNKEKKISILTHLDSYSNLHSFIYQVSKRLKTRFNATLASGQFTAKVFGGFENYEASVLQKSAAEKLLESLNVRREKMDLPKERDARRQIFMNTSTGEINIAAENVTVLEYIQKREYGDWDGCANFTNLFACRLSEAKRKEKDIPKIGCPMSELLLGEMIGMVQVPFQNRKYAVKHVALKLFIVLHCNSNEKQIFRKIIKEENFNLLLRKSAASPRYLGLLHLLLSRQKDLEIDLNSRGEKSGTALDIANANNNTSAIEAITNHLKLSRIHQINV